MMIVIGILAVLVFILSFLILKMQSDLKSINKQMKIKLMKDSNFRVTSDLSLDTFDTLCENLNAMYDKYRDVNIDRNQSEKRFKNMLSYIAHDIRTPLTSAQAYLQLLQDQDEHSENQQYYRIINTRLNDVKNILEQFFLYSKLVNDDYKIELEECNIYEICCQSAAGFYQQFVNNKIEPMIDFDHHTIFVKANKELLRKVFDNLINNAIKHGGDDLKILQRANKIQFCNHAKNIRELDLDKVFDSFYKADVSRSDISSGLGLTIVKKVICLMGWSVAVRVENEIFCITITMGNGKHSDDRLC